MELGKSRRDLFLEKVKIDPISGCWLWTAHVNKENGYGQFWDGEQVIGAHVFAYEEFKGPLPAGTEPDHLCRTRHCVNPEHLEAVTHRENLLRSTSIVAQRAAQTHCLKGHELAGDNLYVKKNGTRGCRACRAQTYRDWVAKNRDRRREIDRQSYRQRSA